MVARSWSRAVPALFDAEAMLFVDHHESQVRKLYPVFDQGVRADQQVDRAVGTWRGLAVRVLWMLR